LHRLFSTFARGWPGVGLLLIRLVAGIALIAHGIERFRIDQAIEPAIFDILAIGDGLLLVVGLWTPIAGSLVMILALWSTFALSGTSCPDIFLATFGGALVLIGPGGWSVDAHLFGWKRIDIQHR
jgi:putative oxidoreductase